MKKPRTPEPAETPARASSLESFHAATRSWFEASFEAPTRVQMMAWPAIATGQHCLVLAPTGSGKTLAAFLVAINRLMFGGSSSDGSGSTTSALVSSERARRRPCRVLYISPLRALAVDVERNLRAPLVGVARCAQQIETPYREPVVAVRTGDTPAADRARFLRDGADILITTPESLFLLLTSAARELLEEVECVIVDEIHALVPTKRGAHLSLSLERLQHLISRPFQRIGLSATQRPLDEVARFLGGIQEAEGPPAVGSVEASKPFHPPPALPSEPLAVNDRRRTPRPVIIVDAGSGKQLDLRVEVPVEDMARLAEVIDVPSGPAAQGEVRGSIWPAIHPLILDLIRKHQSTLIFVNSRRLAERLAAALNELADEVIAHAHHGSIAREQRLQIEDELKSGRLPALVATSSLELGIDMGAIDLVIQVEAPPSVASGLQRIGRAGHRIDIPSKGIIIPKYRGDLLACAALTERMMRGAVEELHYPRNPIDVLAQQIVAMVGMEEWRLSDLERVVRRSAPFEELTRSTLEELLDMLSGRYPSDEFAELRPRVTWDRLNGLLQSRQGAKRVAIANAGTIPDRGLYGVFLLGAETGRARVGELDEEMVFETRVGDTFILGASTWRVEEIGQDRVLVSPAPGLSGKMPFWKGETASRPLEFGRAIGALCRRLRELPADEARDLLSREHKLDARAATNLLQYLEDQHSAIGAVPDDRTIIIESYMDEMGDWRVCILSPFGGKVHAPWAMAIGAIVRERTDIEIDVLWTDDGVVVRFPETDQPPSLEMVIPDPEELEELVVRQLGSSALFAAHFREAAGRALLLPRKRPGVRSPLWQQRRRAADLLRATAGYGTFPIILETFRECLRDVFDVPALVQLLREVRSRDMRVVQVTTRVPSPFAASLMFNYIANFIYEGDAPLAERRSQALMVDPAQLSELLGEVELRELLDPDALEATELYLQQLTPERAVRSADALHDMLIRIGELSRQEIQARSAFSEELDGWLEELERARRIISIRVGGEERYAAAEDAGRYRDALGIPPPGGLPVAFLESMPDSLRDLVARYARTHGPFTAAEVASRIGIGSSPVLGELKNLAVTGRVLEGSFRRQGEGSEWCDTGVLRALRQRSLARLRREVEPVDKAALARLYLHWQGVVSSEPGSRRSLLEVIQQLQGAAIPASILESLVLPSRLPGYDPRDLDRLVASGEVLWVGCGSLGASDGRIALYLAEDAPLLIRPRESGDPDGQGRPDGIHEKIREHLRTRGASFFPQLLQATGGFRGDVLEALWDLVWDGEATNDTLHPLRGRFDRSGARPTARQTSRVVEAARSRWPTSGYLPRTNTPAARMASPAVPTAAAGRWSLVQPRGALDITPSERMLALTQQLLERYGVLTREAVQSEGVRGGFTAVYGVLRALEDAGRVRRGYFVSGLGATQFAIPGAIDRLRSRPDGQEPQVVALAAADPANPYGAAISWPERTENLRPTRTAGALVILIDGSLAGWLSRGERQLLTFPGSAVEISEEKFRAKIAAAVAAMACASGKRTIQIEEVDGIPARESPLAPALASAGFRPGSRGFIRRSA